MMRIDFDAMRRTLGKPLARRVGLAAGVVVAGAVGLLAVPSLSGNVPMPERAACCTGAVAVGDTMISPAKGGDKDFFEVPSAPPSAIFLVGNNESMQDFPEPLPEVGDTSVWGCEDPDLVAAMSWFDKDSTDPAKNGSLVYDDDADFNDEATIPGPQFFDPNMYYQSRGRRIGWVVDDFPFSLDWDFREMDGNTSTWSACNRALEWTEAWGSPVIAKCEACLASKGWWRGPLTLNGKPYDSTSSPPTRLDIPPVTPAARRLWVVSGRVFNVRPPKFVVARKVLKDVINNTNTVRMGVATFGPNNGWYDPPVMIEKLRPSCDLSFPTINETALNKRLLMDAVNKVAFRNNERSIGEALFGLGGYFSSQLVDGRWQTWFQQPITPPWGWPGGWTGGTYDNPHTGEEGNSWGYQNDEWLKWAQPWEGSGNDRSVCFGCQVNSVIVLTDGAPMYDNSVPITRMMEMLIAKGAKHPDGTPLTFDPNNPETNTNPGGVNYCDQFEKAPGVQATKEDCDYAGYNWPTGLATTNKNFMDDVAFFMANMDLRGDMSGNQTMRTYTIGYGDNSAMLRSIAVAGKGAFYQANSAEELRAKIDEALGDLKQSATSFSSANITGVQSGGVQSSVYIPRFVPRKARPYEGHLYRYFYFNEFAQGCVAAKAKSTAGDSFDLNGDKDCDDSFFLDKPASFTVTPGAVPTLSQFTSANIVQENAEGNWVKVKTASLNADGVLEGGDPAVPFWNVGDTVGERKAMLPCDRDNPLDPESGRCIFTMIDRDKDGKFTDTDNPPIEFTTDNLAELKQYLLAGGDNFCAQFFSRQKKTVWTGTATQQEECARDLIRFIRGVDVLNFDGDTVYDEERPCADNKKPTDTKSCKLADIFHSTPVTVDPPADPFLCSMGVSAQCLPAAYQDFSTTVSSLPLCSAGGPPCYKPTPMNPERTYSTYGAYDSFKDTHATRERIALVGSNGGMLHAIHVGSVIPGKDKKNILDDIYDLGTGQEMWAFIPPDLLPKLGQIISGHQYFVDGSPMVRDIWADGAVTGVRNGVKEPEEFRTLAVITERGGGQRYIAVDVTNPREMLKADGKAFRWMFPNACDPESASVGQSWSNFTPKPPPIGPVRLKPLVNTPSSTARGWEERWIVMLNGGFSPDLSRGRGLYMLDVWTGNKLWSAEAHPGPVAGDSYKALLNQMMPIVASPSLVDLGKGESVRRDLDGFFDTLIVGDMGGQVWTFRFFEPGERNSSTEVVKNWFGARSLEMSRDDSSVGGPKNAYLKAPFTNIASNITQPETGWLRSYMGTGDRSHLRTTPGSDCGPDDLLACVRLKCDVKAVFSSDVNGRTRDHVIEYEAGVLKTNNETLSGAVDASVCKASKMQLTDLDITCPDSAIGTGTYTSSSDTQSKCEPSGGMWSCTQSQLVGLHSSLTLSPTDTTTVPSHRYFGFHSYGGPLRTFDDAESAVDFDKLRVTDTPGFNCGTDGMGLPIACSLVDVTIPDDAYATFTTPEGKVVKYVPIGKIPTLAKSSVVGPGWFMRYSGLQERTAAASAIISGVVAWPTFAPVAGGGVTACSLVGSGDISNIWQADVITGLPNQAEGFRLYNDKGELIGYMPYMTNDSSAPPGDLGTTVLVSPTGAKKYAFAIPPPPKGTPDPLTAESAPNTTPEVYWLEVPRNLHKCRHENAADCK